LTRAQRGCTVAHMDNTGANAMAPITLCPSATVADLARFAEANACDLIVTAVVRNGTLRPRIEVRERTPQPWVPRFIAKDQP